jgi:hypothetical protein
MARVEKIKCQLTFSSQSFVTLFSKTRAIRDITFHENNYNLGRAIV